MNRPLSFASLNAFLLPWLITFFNNGASALNQKERADRIASFLKSKDVVALQEVWGSQVYTLQSGLEATHSVPKQYKSTNLWGWLANLLDGILFWIYSMGGLWLAHRKDSKELWSARHVFAVSETKSKKGVSATLLDVDSYWPGKTLLVFNTHLDPHNNDSKWKQINEIHLFISKCINDINAERRNGKLSVDLNHCGVILVGDFNIDTGSRLYGNLISLMKVRDFFKEAKEKNSKDSKQDGTVVTNSYDTFANSLASLNHGGQGSYAGRLDFIFGLDFYFGSSWNQKFMELEVKECNIVKQTKGQELSDHYPVECILVPKE
eukprot:TRINITY_DN3573_c0_g1_i1.p1 TRINITY_DN3573_c0_g1~~TRINITY_DN3573_c0_g1_i1.p1  ORF type:complete len:321 (-),score=122.71 TRINITY_DN3573_c0_g1_i1:1202-2164(-)